MIMTTVTITAMQMRASLQKKRKAQRAKLQNKIKEKAYAFSF